MGATQSCPWCGARVQPADLLCPQCGGNHRVPAEEVRTQLAQARRSSTSAAGTAQPGALTWARCLLTAAAVIVLGFAIYFADLSRVSNSLEQDTIQYGFSPLPALILVPAVGVAFVAAAVAQGSPKLASVCGLGAGALVTGVILSQSTFLRVNFDRSYLISRICVPWLALVGCLAVAVVLLAWTMGNRSGLADRSGEA